MSHNGQFRCTADVHEIWLTGSIGAIADVALVLKRLSVRPFRVRHRPQFPDTAQYSLAVFGPAKAALHEIFFVLR